MKGRRRMASANSQQKSNNLYANFTNSLQYQIYSRQKAHQRQLVNRSEMGARQPRMDRSFSKKRFKAQPYFQYPYDGDASPIVVQQNAHNNSLINIIQTRQNPAQPDVHYSQPLGSRYRPQTMPPLVNAWQSTMSPQHNPNFQLEDYLHQQQLHGNPLLDPHSNSVMGNFRRSNPDLFSLSSTMENPGIPDQQQLLPRQDRFADGLRSLKEQQKRAVRKSEGSRESSPVIVHQASLKKKKAFPKKAAEQLEETKEAKVIKESMLSHDFFNQSEELPLQFEAPTRQQVIPKSRSSGVPVPPITKNPRKQALQRPASSMDNHPKWPTQAHERKANSVMKRSSNNDDLNQEVSITLDIPRQDPSSSDSDFKQLDASKPELTDSKTKKAVKPEPPVSSNIFSQFLKSGSKEKAGNFISKLTKSSAKKPSLLEEESKGDENKGFLLDPKASAAPGADSQDIEAGHHPLSEDNYEDKQRRETTFKNETDSFESQMDEFLLIGAKSDQQDSRSKVNIDDVSSHDTSSLSSSSSSSSGQMEGAEMFDIKLNETNIQKRIEGFYDRKFQKYKLNQIEDYIRERVWNVEYDINFDLIYVFVAEVFSKGQKTYPCPDDTFQKEIDAFQLREKQETTLVLKIQIWNADDRVLRDKQHRSRPIFQREVLRVSDLLIEPMNRFEVMQFMKNKYRDYAQTIRFDHYVYFFQDKSHIVGYNTLMKEFYGHPCRVFENTNIKDFSTALHFKDFGMPTQSIESLLMLNFNQFEDRDPTRMKSVSKLSLMRQPTSQTQQEIKLKQIDREFKQELELRIHNFGTPSGDANDLLAFFSSSPFDKATKQTLKISNDDLVMYYEYNLKDRVLADILFQRIGDSSSYILLFPTGLFLQIGINPFTIQSRQHLGLRRDENILDHAYNVSMDGKKHCIWVLDQKLQVWHYSSERNANQSSWSLQRITIFNKLIYKRFFKEATDYEDFQMMSFLSKIQSFKNLGYGSTYTHEYHFAFNETCTKGVCISQPVLFLNEQTFEKAGSEGDPIDLLEEQMNMPRKNIKRNKIEINMIAKEQPIILSFLPERYFKAMTPLQRTKSLLSSHSTKSGKHLKNMQDQLKDPQTLKKFAELEDEIVELKYMGVINLKMKNKEGKMKNKECHQFVVRRLRSLQVMFTNGLGFWTKAIDNSTIKKPLRFTQVVLSRQNTKMIAYCCIPGLNESKPQLKMFEYNEDEQNFILDQVVSPFSSQEQISYTLGLSGKLITIKIGIIGDKKARYQQGSIQFYRDDTNVGIQIPRCILFREFLDGRGRVLPATPSADFRILICGRVLIHLTKNILKVKDIGCLIQVRDHNITKYQFMSLLDSTKRSTIQKLIHSKLTSIVDFSSQNMPLSALGADNTLYFTYSLFNFQNQVDGTSVVRMNSRNLQCEEIYQSRYQTTHFSLNDQRKNIMARHNMMRQSISPQIVHESSSKSPSPPGLTKFKPKAHDQVEESDFVSVASEHLGVLKEGGQATFSKVKPNDVPEPPKGKPQVIGASQLFASTSSATSTVNNIFMKRQKTMAGLQGSLQQLVQDSFDVQYNFMSLVSQVKNIINIEIIIDRKSKLSKKRTDKVDEDQPKGCFSKLCSGDQGLSEGVEEDDDDKNHLKSLVYFVRIQQKRDLLVDPEVGWVSKNKIIITIDNDYYLLNLDNPQLQSVQNKLFYGTQQVNVGLFASQVAQRKLLKYVSPNFKGMSQKKGSSQKGSPWIGESNSNQTSFNQQELLSNDVLVKACEVIQRMEIASLVRYCTVKKAQMLHNQNRALAFFTPCEELDGGSVFSKLSGDFNVLQPYLEQIDNEFIELMNLQIKNINFYLKRTKFKFELGMIEKMRIGGAEILNLDDEQTHLVATKQMVHMYQDDIVGNNAIDNAFEMNSIFSIKAFVDNLLQLTEEVTFRNCFDQALILMIKKNLDVKKLVNSDLFYPPLWQNRTIFSKNEAPAIRSYLKTLEDLEFDNPEALFVDEDDKTVVESVKHLEQRARRSQSLIKIDEQLSIEIEQGSIFGPEATDEAPEEHEMQFNYIYLGKIQGENKTDLMRYLSQSDDLELFQQEAVQMIVDYKWETYTRSFFLNKLVIYFIFLSVLFTDIDKVFVDGEEERDKGFYYLARKATGIMIQMFFFRYEMQQLYIARMDYFLDMWNYFELAGITLYSAAVLEDYYNDEITDLCRVFYTFTVLFCLVKVLFLLRVFKSISFLVMMVIQVIIDLGHFLIVFGIFVFAFAQCYRIVGLDVPTYPRLPTQVGLSLATLRSAFGDFSLIDAGNGHRLLRPEYQDQSGEEDLPDEAYVVSSLMMYFTLVIYIFQVFTLFMIFMNFIIAVISDSYAQVTSFSIGHNYKQMVTLIHEREVQFQPHELMNEKYFPNILIVRQKKKNDQGDDEDLLKNIRSSFKDLYQKMKMSHEAVVKETKDNLNSQVKLIENEILNLGKDLQKVYSEVQTLAMNTPNQRMMTRDVDELLLSNSKDNSQAYSLRPSHAMSPAHTSPVLPGRQASPPKNQASAFKIIETEEIEDSLSEKENAKMPEKEEAKASTTEGDLSAPLGRSPQPRTSGPLGSIAPTHPRTSGTLPKIPWQYTDQRSKEVPATSDQGTRLSNPSAQAALLNPSVVLINPAAPTTQMGGTPQISLRPQVQQIFQGPAMNNQSTNQSQVGEPTPSQMLVPEPKADPRGDPRFDQRLLSPAGLSPDQERLTMPAFYQKKAASSNYMEASEEILRKEVEYQNAAHQYNEMASRYSELKRENSEIKAYLKTMIDLQKQMQLRLYLNTEEQVEHLPGMPILNSLMQRSVSQQQLHKSNPESLLPNRREQGRVSYPKTPLAVGRRRQWMS